ncbi:50S ribosome-binding GTPase [Halobacillus salinarum]|uniref:50S ribosome-binding GTPase n=1 Tax=Halobacillus salinarum TaxID=2932257 RepID=A0ABY4EKL5_9BACI|nr:FeoB small GTPase domain-containing protein [Halobacillus salinarum]UOQ44525.1 50S ribosome-binding GTPase [Halobacillus salinarum]
MKHTVALAGNPNTGKSTLFNVLTGMNQHTGNWPGKTVMRAEGSLTTGNHDYHIVDLPGTYSLYSNSEDEEVARDYIIFEKPAITLVVVDATSLERNLNIALQVLEMTSSVIVCVNLIDEARRKGIEIDKNSLSEKLGVPVILMSAREKTGIIQLLKTMDKMIDGKISTSPYQIKYNDELEEKIEALLPKVEELCGDIMPSRWLALRLLDGDTQLIKALKDYMNNTKAPVAVPNKEEGECCHGA